MTTRKDDGRKLIQITVRPDMYDQLKRHCHREEIPVTVWVRQLLRRELDRLQSP